MGKKIILNIIFAVCALAFIGCGIYLFIYYSDMQATKDDLNELSQIVADSEALSDDDPSVSEDMKVNTPSGESKQILKRYKKLYKKNNDMIGWVKIDDTMIDYPVMMTPKDNEYYLHRNFEKKYDRNGLPFLDKDCDPDDAESCLLVYGHHMKSGMMFADIMNYESEDFYKKHKIVSFDTLYDRRQYEVVAAFRSQVYKDKKDKDVFKYYDYKGHLTEKEFDTYIKNIKKLSAYDTGITPTYGDQLL
ncbi:MAG: sortase, partial [Eubacterium sp.]|nr:sortase [Eubacterium sp.]